VAGEDDHIEAAPIGSRAANYAVVDRIRDLAKWLLVVLGAIGGVLIAGSKLSDIGAAHGSDRFDALVGVGVALLGAAIALGFIARVLLPIRLTLSGLEKEVAAANAAASGTPRFPKLTERWRRLRRPVGELVHEEKQILCGYETVGALREARWEAAEAERAARDAQPVSPSAVTAARENREAVDEVTYEFLAYALAEKVKRRMVWASAAVALGATLAAAGIVVFSVATHGTAPATAGEVVPKRPSAVTVELSEHGRDVLTKRLGDNCPDKQIEAIALGGEPDALDVVSVPTANCATTRFTLTENIGVVVNAQPVDAGGHDHD
jgi:hypothetical protein